MKVSIIVVASALLVGYSTASVVIDAVIIDGESIFEKDLILRQQ